MYTTKSVLAAGLALGRDEFGLGWMKAYRTRLKAQQAATP
jgi:hypothetical protein